MAKVKVTIIMNPKTGVTMTDITTPNDDDCDRARRVIEAAARLLGMSLEDVEDDVGGPRQVETESVPNKVKN